MLQYRTLSFVRNGLIAILHTFLLVPIFFFFMELNRVPNEQALWLFFLMTQLLAVLFYKWWVFIPIQIGHIHYRLYALFPPLDDTLTFREWMGETWELLSDQLSALLEASLTDVPDLLIFTLLFLLITLLTTLAVHKKIALPSFLVPFSYLMIVHTFTDNRVLSYMVVLVGVGFLLIALMRMSTDMHWTHFLKNMTLTALVTIGLVAFSSWGINRFRLSQEWVEVQFYPYQRSLDDNGFFEWINTYSAGIGYQRTGFGLDDTNLGGPLHQDFTPLFRAYTDAPHYWKVLHRTEYTGSGWENTFDEYYSDVSEPINHEMLYPEYNLGFENMKDEGIYLELTIQWHEDVNYIAYPYGWSTFDLDSEETEYLFHFHDRSGYYTIPSYLENTSRYSVYYDNQFPDRFDEERLTQDDGWRKETNDDHRTWMEEMEETEEFEHEHLVAYLFEDELQLPETLPQRVSDLAEEITDGLENEYEMVRAIESYLKEDGGYRYSLLEVESTPEGEDYVDYFLFESLIGYCDNFSSAMTILLRTLGIPARWTKGFTPGDYHGNGSNDSFYQVSNANAHSWVEVYFPSFGWVPFEPSPSFANPVTSPEAVTSISQESYVVEEDDFIDLEEVGDEFDSMPEEESSVDELQEGGELKGTPELVTESEIDDSDDSFSVNWARLFNILTFVLSVLLVFSLLLRWTSLFWVLKVIIDKSRLSLEKACHVILRLFELKQKRASGQTVEAYMNQWKPFLSNDSETIDEFIYLVNSTFYGPSDSKQSMTSEQKEIIVNMIDIYEKSPSLKRSKHDDNPLR